MNSKLCNRFLTVFVSIFFMWAAVSDAVAAYNVRKTTNADGLSNSAILSLCYDAEGFLWIGTCDGVNIYDGSTVRPFSEMFPGMQLDGNIVEGLRSLQDGSILIQTNYGLNLVNKNGTDMHSFPQFHGQERITHDAEGNVFLFAEDKKIYYYRHGATPDFKPLLATGHSLHDIRYFMWRDNSLWIITGDGIMVYGINAGKDGSYVLKKGKKMLTLPIVFATGDDELFIVTADNAIYSVGLDGKMTFLADMTEEMVRRGKISDIIRDLNRDIFVSFGTDGLVKLTFDNSECKKIEDLGITSGVFCLERSPVQDVVWAGSDCQGLYSFLGDKHSLYSYSLQELSPSLSHPVRAIYIDHANSLWIGTKGDGLLRIDGVGHDVAIPAGGRRVFFNHANSALLHNEVYALAPSSKPLLWIATDGGVNYFDYRDQSVKALPGGDKIKNIHGIYEENDSTLWFATLGWGVVKAVVGGTPQAPALKSFKHYYAGDGSFTSNYFFSLAASDDGRLFFANRGMGAFEVVGDSLKMISMRNDYGTRTVRDIFSVLPVGDTLWLGSGHGLLRLADGKEQLFYGAKAGFINSTIHDIREGNDSQIWISTNKGIVKFNPATNEAQSYDRSSGLAVMEYSDGAAFKTDEAIIFGGIDGISVVSKNPDFIEYSAYNPLLSPRVLNISGENVPLAEFITHKAGKNRLTLSARQNHFSVTFTAPDFMNSANYTFYYSLDGKNWINNGLNNTVSFNEMDYGDYNLSVKYLNRATNTESEPYELSISVLPPWYLSAWAKIVYMLIIVGVIGFVLYSYVKRQRRRQEEQIDRMKRQHKEDVYEEKLRFFTNITHEFCTPLTLMYGPCERIMSYPGSDDYIKKYVRLVQNNTERLNNLIQELIDFRRMETGHKRLKIARFNVSDLCCDIMHSFSDLSERNNIDFKNEITPDIEWNSDFECIRKTMTNLISNAFKYTPVGGCISVRACVEGDSLKLSVYNTGKGIREEDKASIFNRYSVLDNVEENAVKGLSSRNGLGLAICHSMVEMLSGRIDIDSVVGSYACFIVTLPELAIPVSESCEAPRLAPEENVEERKNVLTENESVTEKKAEDSLTRLPKTVKKTSSLPSKEDITKPQILVIDDNKEILALLSDGLGDYNVVTAESAEEGLWMLKQSVPDLIITDIMMPGTDGIQLTRQIKGNRHTMYVPLIILSAKNTNEEKIEGIGSGADVYIGKPFSFTYLKAVVARLLENRERLKEYYNSSASAFNYSEGKLISREEKETIQQINEFIDSRIDDGELTPEEVAEHMQCSLRNLYRRFKELGLSSPNDHIKTRRIYLAAKLLVTTSLTVQEIIFRCGFSNRSHFYREFDKHFSMTPKDYRMANKTKDEVLT